MNQLIQSNVKTMSSKDLLELINQVRFDFNEKPVRLNDFNNRIYDELEGDHYESFVVQNSNGTEVKKTDNGFNSSKFTNKGEQWIVEKFVSEGII